MEGSQHSDRLSKLGTAAYCIAVLLFVKALLETIYEYRWYFPVNFDESMFLMGRRETFIGLYRLAFYAHIISGPIVIVVGSLLMSIGGRPRYSWLRRISWLHRPLGRIQMAIVLAVVVPSGLVMAMQAYTGPIAGSGFAAHSIATGWCAVAAIRYAITRRFQLHQQWATRCFILLCSPLLLRLISGATIVAGVDSDWTYRITAWVSWILPVSIYEVFRRRSANALRQRQRLRPLSVEEAFG